MKTIDSRRMYLFLLLLTIASFAGFQGWRTLVNNFAVEIAGLGGEHMGVVQSVREVPGFLALLVIYLLLVFSEHRLAALSVAFIGLGVGLTGYFPSFAGLTFTTLIMSFGFHYYETLNQSLTLQYFDRSTSPLVFGRLRAVGSFTNICVGATLWFVAAHLEYADIFAALGLFVMVAAFWALTMNPADKNIVPQHRRMIVRRRYWLFYALTLLAGARRQIFVAFAVFLLVKKFGFGVQHVAALFVLNNLINTAAAPLIGRAVNRFGERAVLSVEYATLVAVFAVYAFSDNPWLVAGMYVVDHLVFNFAMAIRTFFQKIADPADIAPSMAVGFTINHVAAVVIPAVGGLLWMVDYRVVFCGAIAISLGSLVLTQLIPGQLREV